MCIQFLEGSGLEVVITASAASDKSLWQSAQILHWHRITVNNLDMVNTTFNLLNNKENCIISKVNINGGMLCPAEKCF
jgi:hypothetical protein